MKQRPIRHYRILLGVLLTLAVTAAARANTVEYVRLTISDDVPLSGSNEMTVSDGRIGGFRMPFVEGKTHVVTIIGNLTDLLDRVEITEGSRVIRTIAKRDLTATHTSEHGGRGKIFFTLLPNNLPQVGNDFQIRIRFAVETSGYDKLDCKVVRRGTIRQIEWTTLNDALLPLFGVRDGVRKTSLSVNNLYTLHFTGDGFASSTQVGDGIRKHVLGQDITAFSATTVAIDASFRMLNVPRNSNNEVVFNTLDMNFCDDGAGNIPGGWGPYINYRIATPLPAGSDSKPVVTNLLNLCIDCISAPIRKGDIILRPK